MMDREIVFTRDAAKGCDPLSEDTLKLERKLQGLNFPHGDGKITKAEPMTVRFAKGVILVRIEEGMLVVLARTRGSDGFR